MAVWLAEYHEGGRPGDVLGIFSDPEKARDACQDKASEYFGADRTPPLNWTGDDGHCSADYHQPAAPYSYLFQVTRFTVDEGPG